MEIFFESENTWWPQGDTLEIINSSNVDGFNGYYFGFDRLGWANIDYFTKFDLDFTDISICLPEGYRDERIAVWIVFKDHDIVLNSYGENLPIGEAIDIICIAAEDEETFRIDIQEATVHVGLKVNLNPQIQSVEQIKALLKELD